MKKKLQGIFAGILAAVLLMSGCVFAAPDVTVLVDGNKVVFDVLPLIEDGRTLVPLRAIFEALGASVEWDDAAKTVVAEKDGRSISLTIGEKEMTVNGEKVDLDVPAKIIFGRTLVPVRAVSEALGVKVDWNAATRTVIIGEGGTSADYYSQYRDIVAQLEAEYGVAQMESDYGGAHLTGVGIVRLLDMNNDGIDELILMHPAWNEEYEYYYDARELWTVYNGKPVQLIENWDAWEIDATDKGIYILQHGGEWLAEAYIWYYDDVNDRNDELGRCDGFEYYAVRGDKLEKVCELSCNGAAFGIDGFGMEDPVERYYINGREVSMEEWLAAREEYSTGKYGPEIPLYGSSEEISKVLEETLQTREKLGL